MQIKGVLIPGLSMERSELPDIKGFVRLQNPEISDGVCLSEPYSVEDIAAIHAKSISNLNIDIEPFYIIGMSLGGMIASVLASSLRTQMPRTCSFHFFVTSANLPERPAITNAMIAEWQSVNTGDVEGMRKILSPFFSEDFLKNSPEIAEKYFQYRAKGNNKQSAKAFMRQVGAVLKYSSRNYFQYVNADECHFIHGASDRVFDSLHQNDLKAICPDAEHVTIANLGHMVNLEMPELFDVTSRRT